MLDRLQQFYPKRVLSPNGVNDIPNTGYMVYILTFNNSPIVLGHGEKNRAKVIFDNKTQITTSHLKALFVRLYNLFGNGEFKRYIIKCQNKEEAKRIENNLHKQIGGNNRNIPTEIRNQLFNGLDQNSVTYLVLEIALRSSFDGLSDIRKWRADGILSNEVWAEISQRLYLNENERN
jgi:hypothetical protein